MKNKHFLNNIITIILLLINSIIGYSQPVTWYKVIGDPVKSMSGVSIVQTYDGGYVLVAYKGSVDPRLAMLKLDYLGNLQWLKYPADTITSVDPVKIVQTNDSGFVILCLDAGGNFLLKTDKDGNFKWRKDYPDTAVVSRLYGFTKTLDNGFILCGNYDSYNPPSEKGYLIKTDSLGNVKWQRGYLDSISNNYGDVIQFPDSNFYISGYTWNFANKSYSVAKKFSFTGDVIWTKIFNVYSGAGMLTKVLNDKIAVWSTTQSYGYYITLLDTISNIDWSNFYTFPDQLWALNSISNGNIVVSGFVNQGSTIGINRLNLSGNSNFSKTFIHPGFNLIGVNCTANTNDNGFILTGSADIIFKSHILVVKTDSLFNAPLITNITNTSEINKNNFELYQNYPNPFNPITNIKYQIQKTGLVTLKIYDITGREIKTLVNEIKNPGSYIVTFNGTELSSGVYFYRIQAGDFVQVKKMVLIK